MFRAALLAMSLLAASAPATAQLVDLNDPLLPPALDGFNITRDPNTGFDWLDLTATSNRTFGDLIGLDGTNEFGPGGDFEGFRHATRLEVTGWINGPQQPSLFIHFGMGSTFAFIAGYGIVRDFQSRLGCFGACGTWGYSRGICVANDDPTDDVFIETEAFPSQGFSFGSLGVADFDAFTLRPENQTGPIQTGHYLIRNSPAPVPTMGRDTGRLALVLGLFAAVLISATWVARRSRLD